MDTNDRTIECHCINLRRANQALTEYYNHLLAPTGLTISQFSLLGNLMRIGPASISDLAERVGLERSTLVRSLGPLFKSGYVEDLAPAGARNRQLRLTEAGQGKLGEAYPLWQQAQKGVETALGKIGMGLFYELVTALEGV